MKVLSMNSELTQAVRAALSAITPPWATRPLSEAGADIAVSDGRASIAVAAPRDAGARAEDVRLAAEAAAAGVPGVKTARAILTAHGPAPKGGGHKPLPGRGAPAGKIELPGVRSVIAVASGKGGVGKSTVAANLAVGLARKGRRIGFLDADIYGPSAPTLFGLDGPATIKDDRIQPRTAHGISVLSIGFMVDPEKALIWRGPMVMGAVSQMLADADWGELDALIIDTPPGTGDAHLTLAQRAPLSGVVLVTTPQNLAFDDARRSGQMFERLEVPVYGVVENMSYMTGPDGTRLTPFGEGGGAKLAESVKAPLLARLPLDPALRETGDAGAPLLAGDRDAPAREAFLELVEAVDRRL